MSVDPTQVIFSTTIDTLKNYDTVSGTVSIPSSSYTVGQYKSYSTTIDLGRSDTIRNTTIVSSTASSTYWVGDFAQFNPQSGYLAQTRLSVSGTTATLTVFVVRTSGGASVSAFDVTITMKLFTTPFT